MKRFLPRPTYANVVSTLCLEPASLWRLRRTAWSA